MHRLTERSDVEIAVQFRGKVAWSERQLLKKAPRENQNQVFIHYDPRDAGKKYLADFFSVKRGGGYPLIPLSFFGQNDFPLRVQAKTVSNS